MFTANEQGNSVSAYRMDPATGLLTHLQVKHVLTYQAPACSTDPLTVLTALQTSPTVPLDFAEVTHCAEIKITPCGRWLVAPNRGHDSIAIFGVDGTTGALTLSEICAVVPAPVNMYTQHQPQFAPDSG